MISMTVTLPVWKARWSMAVNGSLAHWRPRRAAAWAVWTTCRPDLQCKPIRGIPGYHGIYELFPDPHLYYCVQPARAPAAVAGLAGARRVWEHPYHQQRFDLPALVELPGDQPAPCAQYGPELWPFGLVGFGLLRRRHQSSGLRAERLRRRARRG